MKSVTHTFADVGENEVFMPADWREWPGADPKRHYTPNPFESGTALRVRFKGGRWRPFNDGPLMGENIMSAAAVYKPAIMLSCAACQDKINCQKCGKNLCGEKEGKCTIDGHYDTPAGQFCTDCYPQVRSDLDRKANPS